MKMKLIIGNKNYSSWSLRPWLVFKYFEIPFQEIQVPLYTGNYKERLLKFSPSGKVPALVHGPVKVWDSLSIIQYAAELFPRKRIWPKMLKDRSLAYAISQEMHSGFHKMRKNMPMNIRGFYPGRGMTPEVEKDVARILQIWTDCRKRFSKAGPFLFGKFTAADAMFAPVVTRFVTYGVPVKGAALDYMEAVHHLPAFIEWKADAQKEPWVIPQSEIYNSKYRQ